MCAWAGGHWHSCECGPIGRGSLELAVEACRIAGGGNTTRGGIPVAMRGGHGLGPGRILRLRDRGAPILPRGLARRGCGVGGGGLASGPSKGPARGRGPSGGGPATRGPAAPGACGSRVPPADSELGVHRGIPAKLGSFPGAAGSPPRFGGGKAGRNGRREELPAGPHRRDLHGHGPDRPAMGGSRPGGSRASASADFSTAGQALRATPEDSGAGMEALGGLQTSPG